MPAALPWDVLLQIGPAAVPWAFGERIVVSAGVLRNKDSPSRCTHLPPPPVGSVGPTPRRGGTSCRSRGSRAGTTTPPTGRAVTHNARRGRSDTTASAP